MKEHAEDLAQIITVENGKPLADARGEIAYGGESAEQRASSVPLSGGPSKNSKLIRFFTITASFLEYDEL
jgi:acyl-CoA reductase-like NAD-dependent aldehyde dehydrogenase